VEARAASRDRLAWAAVAAITLAAAVLRLYHLGQVLDDPFYDAAVKSMTLSWHNFFFGAFEPGASVSIDKPPVDLWLQVASVKLFGVSSTSLKLPEALAGIAAVPLLFAAVRRMWSTPAALTAAAALALMPIAVITSRSDTMDGVMMALIVLALLLILRACERGSSGWLLGAAVLLGVAFDVKLLESLVAVPGLALLAYLGLPGSRRRRLLQMLAAGAVYLAVALAWLTATLLVPAHDRPYAIGSTNGSAWNAAFVFNGSDRLAGKSPEPGGTVYEPGHRYPVATQEERDHIPIVPPSLTRLLATVGPLSGERLGLELLVGLLLGIPALAFGLRGDPEDPLDERPRRLRLAVAVGTLVWALTGIVLFSHMIRLHPRYVESFTPAVAILLGIGVAWACSAGGDRGPWRARLVALAVALAATAYYVERLLYERSGIWWLTLVCALAAFALAAGARCTPSAQGQDLDAPSPRGRALLGAGAVGLTLVAVLALPLRADLTAIEDRVSDAGYVGALPAAEEQLVSAYVRAHQDGARYELAAESSTEIGALVVKDARPIVVLTTYNGRVFTSVAKLRRLIAAGEVRYAFLNTFCAGPAQSLNAACSAPVKWVRAHGTDVSLAAGLHHGGLLYLLPRAPANPARAARSGR
jgi:4-amino-4-deoxy-L-arabinose transferase-like glycosyltransferase